MNLLNHLLECDELQDRLPMEVKESLSIDESMKNLYIYICIECCLNLTGVRNSRLGMDYILENNIESMFIPLEKWEIILFQLHS